MPITFNGSGTVTGISAGGLPDGVITTDDLAAGAVTPAKSTGGPAFHAYSSSGIASVTANVATKVPLNTERYDTNSCFDSTTNYRFTPTTAGYYQVSAAVYFAQQGTTWRLGQAAIFRNGTAFCYAAAPPFNGNSISVSTSSLVYLNGSTDYIELYCQADATGTIPLVGGSEYTFMSAALVRPA